MTFLKLLAAIRRLTLSDGEVPTWQASTQRFIPSSTGGSSSLIHQASVTLTDAQVKALPTTPFTTLPSPGAGRWAFPTLAALVMDATAGAYTNHTSNTRFYFAYTLTGFPLAGLNNGLINFAAVRRALVGFDAFPDGLDTGLVGSSNYTDDSALQLAVDNAGNFTGGDLANTLVVAHPFYVYDDTLKRFLTVAESGWDQDSGTFA